MIDVRNWNQPSLVIVESVLASWGEAEPLADPIPRFSDYVHSTVVPCSGDEAEPGESHCAIVLDQSLAVNSRFPCDFTWYVVSRDYDEKQRQIGQIRTRETRFALQLLRSSW